MAQKTTIQIRVDEDLKKQAVKVFEKMHMSLSQAIKLFLGQAVSQDGIGIEFRTPSKKLQERMDAVDRDEDMMEFDTVEELFEELDRR